MHYHDIVFQGWLTMLGSLAMMGWLAMTPHSPQTEKKRLGILAAFAFFTGEMFTFFLQLHFLDHVFKTRNSTCQSVP